MGHLFSVLLHIISVILFCFIDSTLYLLFIPSFRWIYNLEDYLQVGDCSTESQNMFKTLWKKKKSKFTQDIHDFAEKSCAS